MISDFACWLNCHTADVLEPNLHMQQHCFARVCMISIKIALYQVIHLFLIISATCGSLILTTQYTLYFKLLHQSSNCKARNNITSRCSCCQTLRMPYRPELSFQICLICSAWWKSCRYRFARCSLAKRCFSSQESWSPTNPIRFTLNLAQLGALCISNLCATKPYKGRVA